MPNPANTDQAIQQFLDALSQLPGSVLYRDMLEWKALSPGAQGEVLQMANTGLPSWSWRPNYFPALMQYNGTSNYYTKTNVTVTNSPITHLFRFRLPPTSLNRHGFILRKPGFFAFRVLINASGALRWIVYNVAQAFICDVQTTVAVDDDQVHYVFMSFVPSTGAVSLIMDGKDVDDMSYAGRKAMAGTLATGATFSLQLGASLTPHEWWTGQIGAIGFRQVSGLNWSDFMHPNGRPKKLNISTWAEWGAQPPVWHESGQLEFNRGSIGALTNNAGIQIALPEYWT